MDDFVRDKLTEWGLRKWIERFEEEEVDRESFYCLDDQQIAKLIPKLGPQAKFKKKLLKEQNTANPDTADASAQVIPSTSRTSNEENPQKGKRKSDLQGESNQQQPPTKKRRPGSYSEEIIRADVKEIMGHVLKTIPPKENNLNDFLRKKIHDLETDEREVVGVFGRTGDGKSYLINAIIGLKNFLPSGSVIACTSVLIKVEANMQNSKYEAIIEFITKEEWRDELWFLKKFYLENAEDATEYKDIAEKLSALYGEDWKEKSPDDLMDEKYFREIPEFLLSKEKILTADKAKELRDKLIRYTRSNPDDAENKGTRRWYWPLVKCVTIKVPDSDLLKHVTLVDLPGNGDSNKSRDKMWKTVVGSCSTIWIVTDINRAGSAEEAWDILKDACSYMGNGGQCNEIHFICTKSDCHSDAEDISEAGIHAFILKRNQQAKAKVKQEFNQLKEVKKHFSEESFKVFTVSSVEFLNHKYLNQEQTEIPKLQEFLQELNDCHKETLNYVSGAHGILSLIQGASRGGGAEKKKAVCTILEKKMRDEVDTVRKQMKETFQAFEKCLSDGVEESERSCEKVLESVINPGRPGGGFHKTLKYLVQNDGIYKAKKTKSQKKRKQINLNMKLSSYLTESIDEKFKETFPNEVNCGPFKGKLNSFSLGTKRMKMKPEYEDVKLQLEFLNAEEDKMKKKLIKVIRERKKMIYSSLMTTVEESMQKCYDDAKVISGAKSLNNMRETMRKHVQDSKNIMYKNAKKVMLNQLRDLMKDILEDVKKTLQESMDLSLKTDGDSIPDVTVELGMVKNHHEELKGSAEEDQ